MRQTTNFKDPSVQKDWETLRTAANRFHMLQDDLIWIEGQLSILKQKMLSVYEGELNRISSSGSSDSITGAKCMRLFHTAQHIEKADNLLNNLIRNEILDKPGAETPDGTLSRHKQQGNSRPYRALDKRNKKPRPTDGATEK